MAMLAAVSSRSMAACSVPGCGRKHAARGLCKTHYARWKRGLELETPIVQRVRGVCTVKGCGRKHAALGFCEMHWRRMKEKGHTEGAWRHRTPSEVRAIRRMREGGATMPEIARKYDCSVGTIERICSRRVFGDID